MNVTDVLGENFPNSVSDVCTAKFNSLGKMGKPKDDGEYTLLACVVKRDRDGNLEVVSLGTGSKCIGASLLPRNGDVLHDSHAEVIARRAFILYLIDQIWKAASGNGGIFECKENKFRLKAGYTFHFYSSHTPCGDASIFAKQEWSQDCFGEELLVDKDQIDESKIHVSTFKSLTDGDKPCDLGVTEPPLKKLKNMQNDISSLSFKATNLQKENRKADCLLGISENIPDTSDTLNQSVGRLDYTSKEVTDVYRTGAKCVSGELKDPKLPGAEYHVTGALRTKPGRGDPTLSMSCSDKIFKWTVLGLQGALLMYLLEKPIYLESITIGHCPYNQEAMERAVFERFRDRVQTLCFPDGFHLVMPKIFQCSIAFPYSRSVITDNCANPDHVKPSPSSLIWSLTSLHSNKHEVSVNGYKLGTTKKNLGTPKSWVSICRQVLLHKNLELISLTENEAKSYEGKSYSECKALSENYQEAWAIIKNHILNNWTRKPKYTKEFKADCHSNITMKWKGK